ncbi:MAG: serine hydrolase [Propioniciclava sp.]
MPAFGRRTLLAGAAALALTGCAPPGQRLTAPTVSPSGSVREQLAEVMEIYGSNTDQLGLSIHDRTSGGTFEFRGDYDSQSASIAKVMIVLLALRQARTEGPELTFDQYGLASRAVIESDNDAADALWELVGGKASYDELAGALELGHTHSDDRSEFWSWTHTTPVDQQTLVDRLLDGSPALNTEDRLYLLDLMSRTNAEQTWGVGHDRGGEVTVQMKNGWVQFQSLDNLWAVNSIGHVVGKDRDYTAAIMCRMPTFDEGRSLVDAIGAQIFQILGTGQLDA